MINDAIYHVPDKKFYDALYLGWFDGQEYWLVTEEGEFRIYGYEYWDDEEIHTFHEDEGWRMQCRCYFETDGCLNIDTFHYIVPKLKGTNAEQIANEILQICVDSLDDVSSSVCKDDVPADNLIAFITRGLEDINKWKNGRVFLYYK